MISFNNQQIICIMNNIGHLPNSYTKYQFTSWWGYENKSLWYIDISICPFNVNYL